MYVFSCPPAVLTARERKISGREEERGRGRYGEAPFLYDTYFYAAHLHPLMARHVLPGSMKRGLRRVILVKIHLMQVK